MFNCYNTIFWVTVKILVSEWWLECEFGLRLLLLLLDNFGLQTVGYKIWVRVK
jgi:hypothetical protein